MNAPNQIKRFVSGPGPLSVLPLQLLAIGRRTALLLATVLFAASLAQAANLLNNGDFNSPNSTAAPTDWSTWTYGAGTPWSEHQIVTTELVDHGHDNTGIYDGSYMMKLGVNNGNGMAGVYQIVGGGPNASYTLTCDSGMQAWWLMYGEIRLIFLDASSAVITNYVVRTTDSLHNEYNGGLGDIYDVGVVMRHWTNSAVSPPGTAFVKVEFVATGASGGNCWFDNAELTSPLVPPTIANLYPNGTMLEQATNTLSFNATSALDITNIVVILNGVNVSGDLVIAGPPTSRMVAYTNLQPNKVYTAAITVTDAGNLSTPANVTFDTFAPVFSWEAEDYDYGSGLYINHPTPSGSAAAGSYFGLVGTEGVDFHDRNGNGTHAYRASDGMAAEATSDQPRNGAAPDFNVGWFDGAGFPDGDTSGIGNYDAGEWVNYTRDFPAGTYNIIARVANGNGGTATIPLSKVVGGWGTSAQTTVELGAFRFPATGWASYTYAPLTDKFGNRIAVTLSGTNTLRVTAGSGGNLNFFMLVAVDTEQPAITGMYPDGSTLVQGTNALKFTVSSSSHVIAKSNVVVTLNGLDVSSNLVFTGSASSWNVSAPLALNVTNYIAVISVTDDAGNAHSLTRYFDTFDPASYAFEAEDFDFGGGNYIDNPVITSGPAANSYFDKTSTDGIDSSYGDVLNVSAPFRWRSADTISTDVCSDTKTRELVAAQLTNSLAFNYNIAYWSTNGWLNYTRHYPAGKYKVYARLAAGEPAVLQLDKVSGSATTYLGSFMVPSRGYNFFDWIPLMDTNTSQMVTLTLDGGETTLRTTSLTGNVNPNSYLLVPAVPVPEALQYNYSAGVLTLSWVDSAFHLQAQTNSLTGTWADYPGGAISPVQVTNNPANAAVFFRLSN